MSTTQNKDAWNLEEIEFKREIPEEMRHRAGWMINTIKFMRIRGWLSTKWASKSSGILESKMDTPKPLEGSKLSELNIADGLKDVYHAGANVKPRFDAFVTRLMMDSFPKRKHMCVGRGQNGRKK